MGGGVVHKKTLAREADGPIVELMVGSGRVAIEVVRETGKPVLGIDSSPAILVIFFKQKTAYELSIGDWSSDVCSSDLGPTGYVSNAVQLESVSATASAM